MNFQEYPETKNYLNSKTQSELKNLVASILTYSIVHFRNIMLNEMENKKITSRIAAIHSDSLHNLPFILNGENENVENWIFELTNALEKFMKLPSKKCQRNKVEFIFNNTSGFEDVPEKVKTELIKIELY